MNKGNENKITSFEVLSEMIKNATLSKKERERLKRELELAATGGQGTIWLKSWDDYEKIAIKLNGDLLSPGGASARVGISRARVHQLENEGKIRVYRIKTDKFDFTEEEIREVYKMVPFWARPFLNFKQPKVDSCVFVDMPSLENYMKSQGRKEKG